MQIPFLDLKAQHGPLKQQLMAAITEVIDSGAFAGGRYVEQFEEAFARYCGAQYAVGVGSGTDALWLALLALGVGPGDEVITVPNSFIATAEAISYCGATPVFVDVDEHTYTMDPAKLEQAITRKTKAIIPVHLYGQMADMDPILEIAGRHYLPVIEDACQAHGAEYKGRKAGTLGVAGAFSFYPGKNIGALGEAGAITTSDPELRQKMRILRDHGSARKYYHSAIGWNARMDGIQGAALSVKLPHLDKNNAARRAHAELYGRLLAEVPGVVLPQVAPEGVPVFHLYVVRVKHRDQVLKAMGELGVNCAIHYPVPLHLTEAYRGLKLGPGSFPVAERCAGEILSLPMFPELTPEQVGVVAKTLKGCLNAAR